MRLILLCVLAVLISCSNKEKKSVYTETDLIATDSLSTFLGLPIKMALSDNYLFAAEVYGDSGFVKIIDIKSDTLLKTICSKGNGPNEFLMVNGLEVNNNSGQTSLQVFDGAANKLNTFLINDILQDDTPLPSFRSDIHVSYPTLDIFNIGKGYIATGYFPDGKLAILDDSLNLIRYVGEYRTKPNESISDFLHCQANSGTSCLTDDKKNIVVSTYFAGVVEMYSIENGNPKKKWETVLFDLDYNATSSDIFENKNVMGFVSLTSSENNIYGLYSGEMEDMDDIATYGKYIYKFDMDGNIVEKYTLDRKVFAIRVLNDKLYAMLHVPEPTIMVYDL